jgi:MFS family permease
MGKDPDSQAPRRWSCLATPGAALAVGFLIVLMLVASGVIASSTHRLPLSGLGQVALLLSFAVVGVVVACHQPRNAMGWVLLGVTFFFLLDDLASSYAYLDYRLHGGRLPLGWLAVLLVPSWAPAVVLAGLSLLLFPDGRILSRRWRPMLWAYLALGALWLGGAFAISLGAVISHHVSIDSSGGLTSLDNPAGSTAWWGGVQAVFFPAIALCWLAWLAGQVLTYRRSSGERRLQLKWLLSGATVFIAAAIATVWINNPTGLWKVVDVLAFVGILALPVSIGFGILKFRLYDIDRIISRTVAYAIVTGLLIGMYAGLVLLATEVFRFHNSVAVAASTLVAAALFNPVRHRVQHAVDRRFNRARYDADQTVAAFAGRLQDAVDLGTVRSDLLSTVDRALEPAHVTVWTAPGATASRPG